MRNVVEDILLLYRLTGWQGRRVPALLPKPGCPPQAASHHGWSCVRWGTGLPLWFGFLGLKRHNYVITGKYRINQKHQPPVNNSFSFFINLLLSLFSISQYFLFLLSVPFSDCHFSHTDVSASSASLALVLGALPSSIQWIIALNAIYM